MGDLVAYIRSSAAELMERAELELDARTDIATPQLKLSTDQRRHLLLITKELLLNVVKHAKAVGPVVRLQFPDLSLGSYAVKVFHDVDDNSILDTNWMGIPKEPYGFSNDAMGTFGPPSFEQASFKVGAGTNAVRIRMKG